MKNVDLNTLSYFSYRIFKGLINLIYPYFRNSRHRFRKARLQIGFKAYLSFIFFLSTLTSCFSIVIFLLMLKFTPTLMPEITSVFPFSIIIIFSLPLVCGLITFLIAWEFPFFRAYKVKSQIESNLPFAANYISVMSAANISPDAILRIMARENRKDLLSDELKFLVEKVDLLGLNFFSAINEEVKISSSPLYSNLLKGLSATMKRGGNLKSFFQAMSKQFLEKRSIKIKQFANTCELLAQMHVLMFTIFPLMLIIMLSIMASVGGSMGGLNIAFLINLMTFLIVPMLGIMYLFLLDSMQPKE